MIIQKRMPLPNEMIVEEISGVLTRRTIDWVETLFNVLKESLESIVKINPSFSEMLLTSFQVNKSDNYFLYVIQRVVLEEYFHYKQKYNYFQ